REGGGKLSPMVEERWHAHPRCFAHEVLRRPGSPAACKLTSTIRTARCGPACRVVWEGRSGRTATPYPDLSGHGYAASDETRGGVRLAAAGGLRRAAGALRSTGGAAGRADRGRP